MSFLICGGGGRLMDQLALYLQTTYLTQKLSQARCRGKKKDTTSSIGDEKKGQIGILPISFQALCARLTQKVCKPTRSVYSSDCGPTCDQPGRSSRATSTLKGLPSEHFTAAEQNDRGAGDPWIMTSSFNAHVLFPIQPAASCVAGGDWPWIPARTSHEGRSNSWPHQIGDSKLFAEPWERGNKLLALPCFSLLSYLEKTSWPTWGYKGKEDILH